MDEKQYTIDNEPASARDLIKAAKALDSNYGTEFMICTTSQAAKVLRDNGHTVGYNHEYQKNA